MHNKTLTELSLGLQAKTFSSVELTQFFLNRIDQHQQLNAYITVTPELALAQAKAADQRIANGRSDLLTGIPIAQKDIFCTQGVTTTCGSKMLANFTAPYNATVIEKFNQAGAVMLGKLNMDEFAMGSSNETSYYGAVKNPWNINTVPGGSSGGSAAAVSARLAVCATGTDTGGSIRQPASFCNLVGLKPTYGTVSRYGLMAMASSLDQIGPIAKTVGDAEIIFNAIKGKDPLDSTSADSPAYPPSGEKKIIGVPESFLSEGVDDEVLKNFYEAVHKFRDMGYEVVNVDLSLLKYAVACYYVLMPAEASANLARFDGVRYGLHKDGKDLLEDYQRTRGEGFGPEVRRRIMLGTYVLSAGYYDAYYNKANDVRKLIKMAYQKVFDQVDVVLTPTAPTPAWKIGEKVNNPLQMYLEDIFTIPANLAGIPAMSIPAGKTSDGLPLGLQLTAPHFREDLLFSFGKSFGKL